MRFTDWWVDGGLSERSEAWYALARHPFFADCYNSLPEGWTEEWA